jgi:hypothetical protein
MGNDEMAADTPRRTGQSHEAQQPATETPTTPGQQRGSSNVDEATMAISVSELFDDDE